MFDYLRDDTLEFGADLSRWPRDRRLAAALALYQSDESLPARERTDWLNDALSDLTVGPARQVVLDTLALYARDPIAGSQQMAGLMVLTLRDYALDYLSERAAEREWDWQADEVRQSRVAV